MPQLIEWTEEFQAQLRRIDQKTAHRILEAISRLVLLQEGQVKKLQGIHPPEYRLRVGEYRVLFRRKGRGILVFAVSTRQGAYRA
jgi:mRNA-degrading endonuclease RelE of RelBE toxin-antitoxin system